jgi:hypothetical protein
LGAPQYELQQLIRPNLPSSCANKATGRQSSGSLWARMAPMVSGVFFEFFLRFFVFFGVIR